MSHIPMFSYLTKFGYSTLDDVSVIRACGHRDRQTSGRKLDKLYIVRSDELPVISRISCKRPNVNVASELTEEL